MLQIPGKLFHTFPATQKVANCHNRSSGLVNVIFTVKITIITHFQFEIHEKLQTRTLFLQIEKYLLTGCYGNTRAILLLQSHRSFKMIHSLDKSEKFTIAKKMLYAPRPESAFTGLVSYQDES
jgi:hypothetical protein